MKDWATDSCRAASAATVRVLNSISTSLVPLIRSKTLRACGGQGCSPALCDVHCLAVRLSQREMEQEGLNVSAYLCAPTLGDALYWWNGMRLRQTDLLGTKPKALLWIPYGSHWEKCGCSDPQRQEQNYSSRRQLTSAGCRRMSREFGVSGRMMPPRQSSIAGISGIANDRRQPVLHIWAH